MRAILPEDPRRPSTRPVLAELPDPRPAAGEVRVEVRAAGVNHADLMQLRGHYPPPPGESEVPGLELAGVVREVGAGVDGWRAGDRVLALVAGGGHGEQAAVPAGQLMPMPVGMGFVEAAAIPEAGLTAWTNLVAEGRVEAGETVVVTGATGGMGRTMVQLAGEFGARVVAAGRDLERLEPLRGLGAAALVGLGEGFAAAVRAVNGGRGADLVLELVGGEHLPRSLAALGAGGRCVLVGLLAGRRAELDLRAFLSRRLRLIGSTLRARSRTEKAALVAGFWDFAGPRYADGRLTAQVDRVFPFAQAAEAYAAMEEGGLEGKVVLEMGGAG
jgi:putative PIG3 family NAD(P)H quinone oxidoreductase